MPAFDLTAMPTTGFGSDGGELVVIYGDFDGEFGQLYDVYVGPNGNTTDTLAFSGKPGAPNKIKAFDDRIEFYMPPLDAGVYDVYMENSDASRTASASNAIVVTPKQYRSSVFSLRKVFPGQYRMGPRRTDLLAPTVTTPSLAPTAPTITGTYNAGDTSVSGTSTYDFATVQVYVGSELIGTGVVIDGAWTVSTRALVSSETLTATVTTVGGVSPASSGVGVT